MKKNLTILKKKKLKKQKLKKNKETKKKKNSITDRIKKYIKESGLILSKYDGIVKPSGLKTVKIGELVFVVRKLNLNFVNFKVI